MGTDNIYGHNNGKDGDPVVATITLDESDTEIVSVTSDDPETQAETESVLRKYIGVGFAARDAIARYAGSYGEVQEIGPDGEVIPRAEIPDRPSAGEGTR